MNLHYSQTIHASYQNCTSLIFLWIYTTLKLCKFSACDHCSLIFLWIYTTLKLWWKMTFPTNCLIFLWIYTTLKPSCWANNDDTVWYSYEFTLLSNCLYQSSVQFLFDIPMNLHYSQTASYLSCTESRFDIPMNLHYSQTWCSSLCR